MANQSYFLKYIAFGSIRTAIENDFYPVLENAMKILENLLLKINYILNLIFQGRSRFRMFITVHCRAEILLE